MEEYKKEILRKAGFYDFVDRIEQNKCPVCGENIKTEDFKDVLSLNEFKISGLCMKCQDKIFEA